MTHSEQHGFLKTILAQRRQGKPGQEHKPIEETAQQGIRAVGVKLYSPALSALPAVRTRIGRP